MDHKISRRDFLKLAGAATMGTVLPSPLRAWPATRPLQSQKKNILVVVFDAFSAYHLSLHGYARQTTPQLARLADRAVVYHNHYAGGSYSTPGTASLLTGVLPWKHRAFKYYSTVAPAYSDKSMFTAFDDCYRVAYSHNPLVTSLLDQFAPNLNDYIPLEQLLLTNDGFIQKLFDHDADIATLGWARMMKKEAGYSYSLFLSDLYKQYQTRKVQNYAPLFPLGLPNVRGDNYFLLEQAVDWLTGELGRIPQPFMGYFHFMPPHEPYNTRRDFYNGFAGDRFVPIVKPEDIFTQHHPPQFLERRRKQYDEFILYVDGEFQRFFDHLESAGLLEETWLVVTSDHGELFERGILGHTTQVLYQPVVRIPLMIFEPGRKNRLDVYTRTSAVDVLPTLLQVSGRQSAAWTEGTVLPPFSSASPDPGRAIYVMQAKDTDAEAPLTKATLILVKGRFKLMYFFGYPELDGEERVELYDIEQDPEELNDLYSEEPGIGNTLLEELQAKLAEMNKPYL